MRCSHLNRALAILLNNGGKTLFEGMLDLVFGKSIKSWYRGLSFFKKILLVMLFVFVLAVMGNYQDKHRYYDYTDKIEDYFDSGKSLLCRDGGNRDLVNIESGWDSSLFLLAHDERNYYYELTSCKRVSDDGVVIPNHYYTDFERKEDQKKGFISEILEVETGLVDEVKRVSAEDYRTNNEEHIKDYEKLFEEGLDFECAEEKINKEQGWAYVSEGTTAVFLKNEARYEVMLCDSDYESPW